MPNGDDANWIRVCAAIDGFRFRYRRWPDRVRLFTAALENIRDHVLTPQGFAVVTSVLELVADDTAPIIAESRAGESYNLRKEGFPKLPPDERTRDWFGQAILIPDLRE